MLIRDIDRDIRDYTTISNYEIHLIIEGRGYSAGNILLDVPEAVGILPLWGQDLLPTFTF